MSGYRNPYTYVEEKKKITLYNRKNAFHRLRGLEFWKEVNKDILPHRTYQSLHERFRKYIIKNIQNSYYDSSFEEQKKIKRIYEDSTRVKNGEAKITTFIQSKRQEGPSNLAKDFIEHPDSDNSFEDTLREKSTETSRIKTIGNASAIAKVTLRKKIQSNADGENGVNPSTSTRLQNVKCEDNSSESLSDSEIFSLKGCTWEEEETPIHLVTECFAIASLRKECFGRETCRSEELASLEPSQILGFIKSLELEGEL